MINRAGALLFLSISDARATGYPEKCPFMPGKARL